MSKSLFLWHVEVERRNGTTVLTVIWSLIMHVVSASRSVRTSALRTSQRQACEPRNYRQLWHESCVCRLQTVSVA